MHDNRVDQPAGRALTAFAFGPVSFANNHLNSEFTGRFGFIDTAVGGVLIVNLGGIHRLIARLFGKLARQREPTSPRSAEPSLPGGETIFDDNFVRLGSVNRSLTSQLISLRRPRLLGEHGSVFRRRPILRQRGAGRRHAARHRVALPRGRDAHDLAADDRAADEHDVAQSVPIIASSFARQPARNVLPTVNTPNQVLDADFCSKQFARPEGLERFLVEVLGASAGEIGGTLPQGAFTTDELAILPRRYAAKAMEAINETQITATKAYQMEALRLSAKLGAEHPKAMAMTAQANAGVQAAPLMAAHAEAVTIVPPAADSSTATISGRVVNAKGQGQQDHTVELVRSNGTRVETLGITEASGFYAASFDEAKTAALKREGKLFQRVLDWPERKSIATRV